MAAAVVPDPFTERDLYQALGISTETAELFQRDDIKTPHDVLYELLADEKIFAEAYRISPPIMERINHFLVCAGLGGPRDLDWKLTAELEDHEIPVDIIAPVLIEYKAINEDLLTTRWNILEARVLAVLSPEQRGVMKYYVKCCRNDRTDFLKELTAQGRLDLVEKFKQEERAAQDEAKRRLVVYDGAARQVGQVFGVLNRPAGFLYKGARCCVALMADFGSIQAVGDAVGHLGRLKQASVLTKDLTTYMSKTKVGWYITAGLAVAECTCHSISWFQGKITTKQYVVKCSTVIVSSAIEFGLSLAGAAGGAYVGALIGALFGPPGAVIGAVAGSIITGLAVGIGAAFIVREAVHQLLVEMTGLNDTKEQQKIVFLNACKELGVAADTPATIVKEKRSRLLKVTHPDKNKGNEEASKEKTIQVLASYAIVEQYRREIAEDWV